MKILQNIIVFVLLPILLFLMYFFVYKYSRKYGTKPKNPRVLRFPRFFLVIPIFGFCFCLLYSIYILLFQFEDWPFIILFFGIFGFPGLFAFIAWSVWKVDIKDDGFVYRNFIGRKVEYKYKDLEYKQSKRYRSLKWYFYKGDKKVFCMPPYIDGDNLLYKKYRKYIKEEASNKI